MNTRFCISGLLLKQSSILSVLSWHLAVTVVDAKTTPLKSSCLHISVFQDRSKEERLIFKKKYFWKSLEHNWYSRLLGYFPTIKLLYWDIWAWGIKRGCFLHLFKNTIFRSQCCPNFKCTGTFRLSSSQILLNYILVLFHPVY